MAKYQKYSEYKDSGVEWLGTIPNHWSLKKHKYIAVFSKGKNPELLFDNYSDGLYPYLSMDSLRGKVESKYAEYKKGLVLVQDNQPLIIWDGSNSGEFVLGKKGLLSSTMASASLIYEIQDQYYWYLCVCIEPEMRKYATGMGIPHVNGEELRGILLPLPDLNEQAQIANFLDHETAKIDTLIAKQEKLIELLKEKRQAVISHAVTKGLNPDVTMKDSGVEWLGQVPEHWKCIKIKHITTTFEQGWSPQCDSRPAESHEHGVLKVGCVNSGSFRSSENKALPPELEPRLQYLIQKDDLLISRANTKELVGSASVVNGDYPNLILCDKLYRLRFSKNVLPEMVSLYLSIGAVRKQIELGATGASHSMQNIGQDTIKELYYLLPPYEEALNILESIKQSNQKFDELTKKAESAIQLMQERRTALISSVVTGKINVSNWQHPNEAKTELSL